MISMDDFFEVKFIREELRKKLSEKGFSKEEIEKFIKQCDEDYKEEQVPYPVINNL